MFFRCIFCICEDESNDNNENQENERNDETKPLLYYSLTDPYHFPHHYITFK
jgi:hypothetical protein